MTYRRSYNPPQMCEMGADFLHYLTDLKKGNHIFLTWEEWFRIFPNTLPRVREMKKIFKRELPNIGIVRRDNYRTALFLKV